MKISYNYVMVAMFLASAVSVKANTTTAATTESSLKAEQSASLPIVFVGGSFSDYYDFVAHSQYANFLTPNDAGSVLLDYGAKQFRLDLTWAHVFNDNQRLKLSAEHFAQDNYFNFVTLSTGETIGQNQFGAAYEYTLPRRWVQKLHVEGYFFEANNGDLNPIAFSSGTNNYIDQRNLAGGEGGGLSAGPQWQIWPGSQLKMAIGYDAVNFSTHNETANNSSGVGETVSFIQQLSKRFSVELMATRRQPYDLYSADINWLAYDSPQHKFGLQLQASHMNSDVLPASHENIVAVNMFYQWPGNANFASSGADCDKKQGASCNLLNWATRSAAYLPGVYVQKDEQVVAN